MQERKQKKKQVSVCVNICNSLEESEREATVKRVCNYSYTLFHLYTSIVPEVRICFNWSLTASLDCCRSQACPRVYRLARGALLVFIALLFNRHNSLSLSLTHTRVSIDHLLVQCFPLFSPLSLTFLLLSGVFSLSSLLFILVYILDMFFYQLSSGDSLYHSSRPVYYLI